MLALRLSGGMDERHTNYGSVARSPVRRRRQVSSWRVVAMNLAPLSNGLQLSPAPGRDVPSSCFLLVRPLSSPEICERACIIVDGFGAVMVNAMSMLLIVGCEVVVVFVSMIQ